MLRRTSSLRRGPERHAAGGQTGKTQEVSAGRAVLFHFSNFAQCPTNFSLSMIVEYRPIEKHDKLKFVGRWLPSLDVLINQKPVGHHTHNQHPARH
jgi:hypothetical protein